ncbi:hypothetical protein [Mycobacterium leprae]|nr:hypothetical protein [Mycobacterium leprae]
MDEHYNVIATAADDIFPPVASVVHQWKGKLPLHVHYSSPG